MNSITRVAGGISRANAFVSGEAMHVSSTPKSRQLHRLRQTLVIYFTSRDFILSSETGNVMDSRLTLSTRWIPFVYLFIY